MSNQECIDWNSCSNLSTPQNSGKQIPVKICAWIYKKKPNKTICYRKSPEQPDWVCVEADSYEFELDQTCGYYSIQLSMQIRTCYNHAILSSLNHAVTGFREMCSFPTSDIYQLFFNSQNHVHGVIKWLNQNEQEQEQIIFSAGGRKLHNGCYTNDVFSPVSNDIDKSVSFIKIEKLFQQDGTEPPCTIKLYKDTEQGKVLVHEKTFQTGCPEVEEQETNTICELEENPSKTATIILSPPEYLEVECYENNYNFFSLPLGPVPPRLCSRVKKIPFSYDPISKLFIKLFPIVVFEACSEEDCGSCPIVKTSCSDCGEDCPEGTCLECPDGSGNVCCIGEDGTVLAIVQKNTQCSSF